MENSNQLSSAEITSNKEKIVNTFRNLGIEIKSIKVNVGPVISLYEIMLKASVSIMTIRNLEYDIMLSLAATATRIIVPIPGKRAIGIEIPNKNPKVVSLQSILTSDEFQNSSYDLPVVLGETFGNKYVITELAKLPHLLVGGATGQGKSGFIHTIINSL